VNNTAKFKDSFVSKALPVPDGTVAGAVIPLGANGLRAYVKTARATTATIAAGTAAQGLADGEATVILIGCAFLVALTLATTCDQFDAIYRAGDGTYTTDSEAAGAVLIGYAMKTIAAPGAVQVAIV
jgi:hypothetical protein